MRNFTICSAKQILSELLNHKGWDCRRMGEMRNSHKILAVKSEGNGPLGRSRRRWENNIKIELSKIERECVHWTHLTQDRGSGGILWRWQWSFGFQKRQETQSSQKELFSMELVHTGISMVTLLHRGQTTHSTEETSDSMSYIVHSNLYGSDVHNLIYVYF